MARGLIKFIRADREAVVVVPGGTAPVGAKAVLEMPGGARIIGRVVRRWNKRGEVLVRFRRGLPGQAVGRHVEIGAGGRG